MFARIWNYEEGQTVNQLDKHTGTEKGVSRLCLMNELDDSLLMVASSKPRILLIYSRLYALSACSIAGLVCLRSCLGDYAAKQNNRTVSEGFG